MSQDWTHSSSTLVKSDTESEFSQHQLWEGDSEMFIQHGDHQDHMEICNVWDDEDFSWINDWLFKQDDKIFFHTNKQLYESPDVEEQMCKLANMRKGGYLPLNAHLQKGFFVPLFTDDSGDEYQLACGQGFGQEPTLPLVRCPCVVKHNQPIAKCLFGLKTFTPSSQSQSAKSVPKHILCLGQLFVKTSKRHVPVVEQTDYNVVIDVDHGDLPVWILAPKQQLDDRARGRGYPDPIEALPVFDGLMSKGSEPSAGYYDTACILDSARRIGLQPSDPNAPNFNETCKLVERSRVSADPVALWLPRDKLLDYVSETAYTEQMETNQMFHPKRADGSG